MTRWSARPRYRCSALAYGSRSTAAAERTSTDSVHHERGRYSIRCTGRGGKSGSISAQISSGIRQPSFTEHQPHRSASLIG
jgi:hypothetical protein